MINEKAEDIILYSTNGCGPACQEPVVTGYYGYIVEPVATGVRIPSASISRTMFASIKSQPRAATKLIVTGMYSVLPLILLL